MERRSGLGATLYFHFPCFDGVVSAVLAAEFLERSGWEILALNPVGYTLRQSWLATRLPPPSAVVDFLYHPDAEFWADHHPTTFLSEDAKETFKSSGLTWAFYDDRAKSCASVLWRRLPELSLETGSRLAEMVRWADKIDSASYDSVEEAIFGDSPALKISTTLARSDAAYGRWLINSLRAGTLADVAGAAEVSERFRSARSQIRAGLDRFLSGATLEGGDIVVFDLRASSRDMVSRYAPFYFFPQARYSLGVIRHRDSAKITSMRNPWREFQSVQLGKIFARHGGGGHERVGSVILGRQWAEDVGPLLKGLLAEIRAEEAEVTAASASANDAKV